MNKKWTLHVENFAKIKYADLQLTPLMCFVGDNNSGKSYLMSLLWGILTLGKDVFPRTPSEAKSYKKCELWLKEHLGKNTDLNQDVIALYIQWFNDLLEKNKRSLLRRIFNYDVEAGKIEIQEYQRDKKLELRWEASGIRYSSTANYIKFPIQQELSREQLLRMNSYICWHILMDGIAAPLFTPVVKGRRMGEPVYLPASRTGFMLTYPQLVENSLQYSFAPESQNNTSALTLPYIDFLQLITRFETKGKLRIVAEWSVNFIESEMTGGKIVVKKEIMPVIQYLPTGIEKALPLYVASSIISEVAPLLLLFKSNIDFKSLIIEEPEAHLHPQLQQKMARLIINLVNRGIPVWVTTHSDTFVQHINNMIKLSKHENCGSLAASFGYTNEDLLDERKVAMYQLTQTDDGKSVLENLKNTGYGFAVPTFNNALENLIKEVYAFQEDEK